LAARKKRARRARSDRDAVAPPTGDSTIVPIPPMPPPPPALTVEEDRQEAGKTAESLVDVRLPSANELGGYHLNAGDANDG
jgi:hypothetical protein